MVFVMLNGVMVVIFIYYRVSIVFSGINILDELDLFFNSIVVFIKFFDSKFFLILLVVMSIVRCVFGLEVLNG